MSAFDFVIVGSGFGGAVAACRLTEAGQRVLVLERGRRWKSEEYPSVTGRNWIFDIDEPERQNGWLDMRWFSDVAVAQGAGVGGGSLIYANVSVPPPESTFESGWPEGITHNELRPYVTRVGEMLGAVKIPEGQRTRRWHFVEGGARALGQEDRFDSLPLAIRFDPQYSPNGNNVGSRFTNRFDREQGTCIHLGDCVVGCRVQAKNTLDLNYLARAENLSAAIRPLHLVRRLERSGLMWHVHYDHISRRGLRSGSVSAKRVVLAAGSLGSTELLLRSSLRGVSPALGKKWSANGDFLTLAPSEGAARPTRGPTITARIDHTDGMVYGQNIFIQDGGFPHLLDDIITAGLVRLPRVWSKRLQPLVTWANDNRPTRQIMPWFAQGIDASNGTLRMGRRFGFFGKRRLCLDWDIEDSRATIEAIADLHAQLAEATGGRPIALPHWSLFKNLITPHPLGGCSMAACAEEGVVDHAGRVFGQKGLYVADGSVIPRAIGRNPSRTIAAVAERAVEHWLDH